MLQKKLLVQLKSDVDSFSVKPRHLERIRQAFPGIDLVESTGKEVFRTHLTDADWLLTWQLRPELYQQAPRLDAVFTPAAGKDWVPPDPSGRIRNFYGHFHGRIMRESLLAMMLYFNRRLGRCLENQRTSLWDRNALDGSSGLFSQQVLMVGYGAIGRQMAELLKAFGARIVGVKRSLAGFEDDPLAERVVTFDSLEQELPLADHVVLMLPGGSATENLFTERHFGLMKPGSNLYNLGRGNCYREEDLVSSLCNGTLAGAGLDVFRQEPLPPDSLLWGQPNVLIMPHASAICREYLDLYVEEWIETVKEIWGE
ncbi:MAG: D-2-hydroxyacid dehydrogenase [Desulfuromonadales bacterium]|nr:D-2-hydroxyacid dehydrogenase [Desulfuromonadales bacterium]